MCFFSKKVFVSNFFFVILRRKRFREDYEMTQMKHTVTLLLLLLLTTAVAAKNYFVLEDGDFEALRKPYTALVKIDYATTLVTGHTSMKLQDFLPQQTDRYVNQWHQGQAISARELASAVNAATREVRWLQLTEQPREATHELRISVEEINQLTREKVGVLGKINKFARMMDESSVADADNFRISGTMELVDAKSGTVLCRLRFTDVAGEEGEDFMSTIGLTYWELGNRLCDFMSKKKPKTAKKDKE